MAFHNFGGTRGTLWQFEPWMTSRREMEKLSFDSSLDPSDIA
jgi:hypothetical protein